MVLNHQNLTNGHVLTVRPSVGLSDSPQWLSASPPSKPQTAEQIGAASPVNDPSPVACRLLPGFRLLFTMAGYAAAPYAQEMGSKCRTKWKDINTNQLLIHVYSGT